MKTVNIEEAKKEFIRFADSYDLSHPRVNSKKFHSLRVMEIATQIATEENFSEEEIEIATLIGLLHDIARFKQFTEYQTFRDHESFDHGDMAVEILEKDNYIRKYIKTDKYDDIIKLAIRNHNKYSIEENLTNEQNKFCKLIRDADKVDILYLGAEKIWDKEKMENSKLNPVLKKEFDEKKLLVNKNYKQIEDADKIIQFLGFIYDLNYRESFKIINEKRYTEKMVHRFEFKDEYTKKEILKTEEETNKYILNKINN